MKTVKVMYKAKCDFDGCKNLATTIICDEIDTNKKLAFCDECLLAIYSCVAKTIVPKGTTAPFKNQKKLR